MGFVSLATTKATDSLAKLKPVFNTVTQVDSGVNIVMGRKMSDDSSSMNAITILTMIFLPATFISVGFPHLILSFKAHSICRDCSAQGSWLWIPKKISEYGVLHSLFLSCIPSSLSPSLCFYCILEGTRYRISGIDEGRGSFRFLRRWMFEFACDGWTNPKDPW